MTDTAVGTSDRTGTTTVHERFSTTVDALDDLPLPGGGRTGERFDRLAAVAAEDLSLARLVEGHTDALAILAESGRAPRTPGARYGVWAARGGADNLTLEPVDGGWWLAGRKAFCSGAGLLDRVLVTAAAPDGYRLVDVAGGGVPAGRTVSPPGPGSRRPATGPWRRPRRRCRPGR